MAGRDRASGVPFFRHPMLDERLPGWRSKLIMLIFFCGFAGLAVRAFWIHGPGNAFYAEQGRKRYERVIETPATRGRIVDRDGRVLAVSLPAYAIWAIPEDIVPERFGPRLGELASLLDMPGATLAARLRGAQHFVYLKRQVDPVTAHRIDALGIPGIHRMRESRRHYPEGEAAAHVVGFTNVEDRGQEGIELAREAALAGRAGRRSVIKDRLGRVVDDAGLFEAAQHGRDVTLTIDNRIQHAAFTELRAAVERNGAKAGAVVVLDAGSGDVLALANWPAYDPNRRAGRSGGQLRNRALTDTFEPGSTIKPINIALALDKGHVSAGTRIDTSPGSIAFGRFRIRDTSNHGVLTVAQIIQKSSNVGMLKVMLGLPAADMWSMFQNVGLGRVPTLGFPGAAAGRLRPPAQWRPVEQASMAYGYGLSTSLLQLAQAYTIFGGTGCFRPARLVREPRAAPRATPVIAPETARSMRAMLEAAAQPGGTATAGRLPDYRVGAKTGTARKIDGKGYSQHLYRATYVGMAPMSGPRVIVAVMIDEPSGRLKYGGPVAGAAFGKIMHRALQTLDVAPDLPVTRTVHATQSALPEAENG